MSRRLNWAVMTEHSLEQARAIASRFDLPGPAGASDFAGKGNINRETFVIVSGDREYLLQLLNPLVFSQPRSVMRAMVACIESQRQSLARGVLARGEQWEPVRLIPTREGASCLELAGENGTECWRMMERIRDCRSYKRLDEIPEKSGRLHIAGQAGRGLAIFGKLTAGMDPSRIDCPLPGYRDTRIYYGQLRSVLAGARTPEQARECLPPDPAVRRSTEEYFLVRLGEDAFYSRLAELRPLIELAGSEMPFGLLLCREMEAGNLRRVVVHGDPKLENFLFRKRTGRVRSLVDLDTVMPHTWLSDWGDMARSLCNVSGERDPLSIRVDTEIFGALARGFLGSSGELPPGEVELMAEAAQVMALELGVRFMTDYLRGDTYFRLAPGEPADLNKTRAVVQFTVFERLRRQSRILKNLIRDAWRGRKG